MVVGVAPAGHIGVQALDAVREALALQEVQRAVDGGRLGRRPVLAIAGDQVIGLHRLAGLQQQLQHPAARRGQPLFGLGATHLGFGHLGGQRLAGQAVVVMIVIAGAAHAPEVKAAAPPRKVRGGRAGWP